MAAAAIPAAATHGASETVKGASAESVVAAPPAASVAAAKPAATTGFAVAKPGHAPGQAAAEGTTGAAADPDTSALAKPGHAPGTAAAIPDNSATRATETAADAKAKPAAMQVSQVRTNFEATEPEGTMYDGQGNVVQVRLYSMPGHIVY